MTTVHELPVVPFERTHPLLVPPMLRELQSRGPIHRVRTPTGDEAWLVVGYELTRRLLGDERLGNSHPQPDQAARASDSLFSAPRGNFETEAADHARRRRLLLPYFTPGRIRQLQHRIEVYVHGLVDELIERGPVVDLHEAVAVPLPNHVISELLGVPDEDRGQFREITQSAAETQDRATAERGMAELFEYGGQLVANKRRNPGEDIVSELCADESLEDSEIAMLSMTLLFAGFETTVAQLVMSLLVLLASPEHWDALAADPDMSESMVRELQRISVKGDGTGLPRYARTDVEADGVCIRSGELVLMEIGAANHDPSVFQDPERFDPTRRQGAPLVFGYGTHFCPGASLATAELRTAITVLTSRLPTMRLAVPLEEVRLRDDLLTGGVNKLPVTW